MPIMPRTRRSLCEFRGPIELRLQIHLHLRHQIADGLAQVAELDAVLGRGNEAELVAILPATLEKGAAFRRVLVGREALALLTVAHDAVALEVAQMRVDRR